MCALPSPRMLGLRTSKSISYKIKPIHKPLGFLRIKDEEYINIETITQIDFRFKKIYFYPDGKNPATRMDIPANEIYRIRQIIKALEIRIVENNSESFDKVQRDESCLYVTDTDDLD